MDPDDRARWNPLQQLARRGGGRRPGSARLDDGDRLVHHPSSRDVTFAGRGDCPGGANPLRTPRRLLQVDRSEFIAQNEVIFAISKTKVAFTQ
jgi:hypothetical protein